MGVSLSVPANCSCADRDELISGLRSAAAILAAIDEGELLSFLPNAMEAHSRHQTAVTLLSVQQKILDDLLARTACDAH